MSMGWGRGVSAALVVLAGAAGAWWLYEQDAGRAGLAGTGPSAARLADAGRGAAAGYQAFPRCRLVPHRNNDGDSFAVALGGDELTLRLYFVDAPEKTLRDYNRKRVGYQAEYFGDIALEDAVEVGQEAKAFALGVLDGAPFTVFTRWEEVYDSGRFYGFARFDGGPHHGRYLSELLVARGLARIYTKGENHPDGRSRDAYKKHLQALESQAKSARRGGWALGPTP